MMDARPMGPTRADDRERGRAGAIWARKTGIFLTGAVFAGVAFSVCSAVLPAQPPIRFVVLEGGDDARVPVPGAVGAAMSAAGGALAAGVAPTADRMGDGEAARPASERLARILRAVPAGQATALTPDRTAELVAAARAVAGPGPHVASADARILADVDLPGETASMVLPATALGGIAGLLASTFAALAAERRARRRRPLRNRWDVPTAMGEKGLPRGATYRPVAAASKPTQPVAETVAVAPTIAPLDRGGPSIEAVEAAVRDEIIPSSAAGAAVVAAAPVDPAVASAAAEVRASATAGPRLPMNDPVAAEAHSSDPSRFSSQPVDADEVAEAAMTVGLRAILVIEADNGPRSCGCVDLVRALAGLGAVTCLVDLGFDRVIADDLGIGEGAAGLSGLLTGVASVADVVHRDAASGADAIVWGNDASERPIDAALLGDLFASLGAVYDCVVVAGGGASASGLARLIGANGTIVVSGHPGSARAATERMADLAASGQAEVLVMTAFPRSRRFLAEAA